MRLLRNCKSWNGAKEAIGVQNHALIYNLNKNIQIKRNESSLLIHRWLWTSNEWDALHQGTKIICHKKEYHQETL